MTRTLVLVGRIGPAFGDRASYVTVETRESVATVGNWPREAREDALRAVFDVLADDER